jgi:hypothetical protein
MIWLLMAFLIPVVVAITLFISATEDFWSIIRFRIDFSRLVGDLVHVLFIIGIGVIAELFALFMIIKDFL